MWTLLLVFCAGVSVGIALIGVLSLCVVAGKETPPPPNPEGDPLDGWGVRR